MIPKFFHWKKVTKYISSKEVLKMYRGYNQKLMERNMLPISIRVLVGANIYHTEEGDFLVSTDTQDVYVLRTDRRTMSYVNKISRKHKIKSIL